MGNRKVALFCGLKLAELALAHHSTDQGCSVLGAELVWRELGHLAIHLDGRRKTRADEQIAAVSLEHQFKQFANEVGSLGGLHGVISLAPWSA